MQHRHNVIWKFCALCSQCSPPEDLFKVIFWLGYCNSMMNPVIYSFSSREFKRAFRNILSCKCRKSDRLKQIHKYSFYDHNERSNSNLSNQNDRARSFRVNRSDGYLKGRKSDSEALRSRNTEPDFNYTPPRKSYLVANPPSFDSDSASLSDNVLEELRQEQNKSTADE
ncbi:alpha-1A adrenergic receptor-like isoform X2 [Ostrea edulis]|uniref:alpha-1A adrenergic receptor-like isoform X2 n=1 Tax=Ostrea edulis TaxID=37623 RepID=UPI0024AF4619|nr:alpha-1A adrenergic receptor-like isoform X2 [Ostrea edulis]